MKDKTIIFCTENLCPEPIFSAVIRDLKKKSPWPIVSVSHKPIKLGTSICIGEHQRSWAMLYKQLLLACRAATTEYIGIAEHDCFYTEEHLGFFPPVDDKFYYNENVWLVCWDKEKRPNKHGTFSKYGIQRLALSQMVCNRKLYVEALERRLDLIRRYKNATKKVANISEPGYSRIIKKLVKRAHSGTSAYIKHLLPDFIELERYEIFNNEIPNLDVRHGKNFTGARYGRKYLWEVPYWGRFESLLQ